MPDLPEKATLAAARVLGNDCHGGPPDEDDMRLASDVLDAAWPHLADAVAQAITEHKYAHEPKGPLLGGKTAEEQRRRTWRRHFGIAAQVAAKALFTEDELKRMAAEALNRGAYIACDIPEDAASTRELPWRPDQLLGARHDHPDMTGPVVDFEPVPEVPDERT